MQATVRASSVLAVSVSVMVMMMIKVVECEDLCPKPKGTSVGTCKLPWVLRFSSSDGQKVCHGVYVYHEGGPAGAVPALYMPTGCGKGFDTFKTPADSYGRVRNLTFTWRKMWAPSGEIGPGISTYISKVVKLPCAACADDPNTMVGMWDMKTSCRVIRNAYKIVDGKPQYLDNFQLVDVSPAEEWKICKPSSVAYSCMQFKDPDTYLCNGDSGAPVFCPLTTGEWVLFGLVDVVNSCSTKSELVVIPLNPIEILLP